MFLLTYLRTYLHTCVYCWRWCRVSWRRSCRSRCARTTRGFSSISANFSDANRSHSPILLRRLGPRLPPLLSLPPLALSMSPVRRSSDNFLETWLSTSFGLGEMFRSLWRRAIQRKSSTTYCQHSAIRHIGASVSWCRHIGTAPTRRYAAG